MPTRYGKVCQKAAYVKGVLLGQLFGVLGEHFTATRQVLLCKVEMVLHQINLCHVCIAVTHQQGVGKQLGKDSGLLKTGECLIVTFFVIIAVAQRKSASR